MMLRVASAFVVLFGSLLFLELGSLMLAVKNGDMGALCVTCLAGGFVIFLFVGAVVFFFAALEDDYVESKSP